MNSEFPLPSPNGPEPDAKAATAAGREVDDLCREIAGHQERNLRLAADFANFRRRSQQESEARAAARKESFIR